jgi:hypothetical protein
MDFDDVNLFMIEKDKYLFFDIFCKNNELVLICPVYNRTYTKYNNIVIKHNGNILQIKDIVKKIEREPIVVIIFNIEMTEMTEINVEVSYNNIINNYNLCNHTSTQNKTLAQTTLMKDDYKLIDIFHQYYLDQGVQYFYIYYNGILTDEIKKLFERDNVKLIGWNYHYWNKKPLFEHHAQLGQMYHALYKYGKCNVEYMIFNDFDEYMYNPNIKLIDMVKQNNNDTIGFFNNWCNTLDNKIPLEFPTTFYKDGQLGYNNRSKCIHKTDNVVIIGIHTGKTYIKKAKLNMDKNNMLLHFNNWCNTARKKDINMIYTINIK